MMFLPGARATIVAMAMLVAACTSKPKPAKVTDEEKARAEARKANKDKVTQVGKGSARIGKQLEAVCERLACTDAQRPAVEAMLLAARARRFGAGRRSPLRNREANKALATAFAGATFSAETIATYRGTPAPAAPKRDDGKAVDSIVALHAALSAEQRTTLAETIREEGLHGVTSPRRAPSRKLRAPDPQRKATRIAKRLCTDLACTDDQVASIAEIVAALPEVGQQAPADARETLATAVAATTLSKDAVQSFFAAEDGQTEARVGASDRAWLQVHALLDADQRKTLSATIETRGLQPIGTGRGRRRGVAGLGRPR